MDVFIIGRPYQLFNSIGFAISKSIIGDAIIIEDYSRAEHDYELLKRSGIFRNVYFVKGTKRETNGILNRIHCVLSRSLSPRKYLEKMLIDKSCKDRTFLYDNLFFSSFSSIVISLLKINKKSNLYVIEDGLGTYIGNSFLGDQSIMHKLSSYLFGVGNEKSKINGVYLYSPDMVVSKLPCMVCKMPVISKDDKRLIDAYRRVFTFENLDYLKKYIVLSERLEGLEIQNFNLYDFIYNVFQLSKIDFSSVCYRLHPAEKIGDYYGKDVSTSNEMWELLCMNYVDDDSVLITIISTAVFSPKRIFKKEPIVVFLYNIVGLHERMLRDARLLGEQLKKSYSNKERVFAPNTIDELIHFLHNLKRR